MADDISLVNEALNITHRKVCGDCLSADLPSDSVSLLYADPPYGAGVFRKGRVGGYSDRRTGATYLDWLVPRLVRAAGTVLNGWVIIQQAEVQAGRTQVALEREWGEVCGVVAWQSMWPSGFKSRAARFWPRTYDLLLCWRRGEAPFYPTRVPREKDAGTRVGVDIPLGNLWIGPWSPGTLSFSHEKLGWPDQKPSALLRRIIQATTNPGDLVLDPFAGSGTTLRAASATRRRSWSIEEQQTSPLFL